MRHLSLRGVANKLHAMMQEWTLPSSLPGCAERRPSDLCMNTSTSYIELRTCSLFNIGSTRKVLWVAKDLPRPHSLFICGVKAIGQVSDHISYERNLVSVAVFCHDRTLQL